MGDASCRVSFVLDPKDLDNTEFKGHQLQTCERKHGERNYLGIMAMLGPATFMNFCAFRHPKPQGPFRPVVFYRSCEKGHGHNTSRRCRL